MNYTLENFISFCNNMQIANEASAVKKTNVELSRLTRKLKSTEKKIRKQNSPQEQLAGWKEYLKILEEGETIITSIGASANDSAAEIFAGVLIILLVPFGFPFGLVKLFRADAPARAKKYIEEAKKLAALRIEALTPASSINASESFMTDLFDDIATEGSLSNMVDATKEFSALKKNLNTCLKKINSSSSPEEKIAGWNEYITIAKTCETSLKQLNYTDDQKRGIVFGSILSILFIPMIGLPAGVAGLICKNSDQKAYRMINTAIATAEQNITMLKMIQEDSQN